MPPHKISWRPVHFLVLAIVLICTLDAALYSVSMQRKEKQLNDALIFDVVTSSLGLTDLCVSTEARYTRHPAVSDPIAPFMDHPGAVEHFPTGSFWIPPSTVPDLRRY